MKDMASENILEDLFLREKPARILVGLKKAKSTVYPTLLSKEANCTYSHTIKILNTFMKLGLVEFDKEGRIKKVKLTDSGWEIAQNMEVLVRKFGQMEQPIEKKDAKKTLKAKPEKQEKIQAKAEKA